MPLAKIEIVKGRSEEYKAELFNSVHDALVNAVSMQEGNCNIRLYELDESCFRRKAGKTEKFTLIEFTIFPGRSAEKKKALILEINRLLGERLQITPNDIFIVINEPPIENWGFLGIQASELEMNKSKG